MTYATQQQLIDAAGGDATFVSLTDWNRDQASDAAVVASAQTAAEAWIDTFVPALYTVPIANPSEELRELAAAETIYRLRKRRNMAGPSDVDDRKERERYLEMIRSGRVRPDALVAAKSAAVRTTTVALGGELTRCGLKGIW